MVREWNVLIVPVIVITKITKQNWKVLRWKKQQACRPMMRKIVKNILDLWFQTSLFTDIVLSNNQVGCLPVACPSLVNCTQTSWQELSSLLKTVGRPFNMRHQSQNKECFALHCIAFALYTSQAFHWSSVAMRIKWFTVSITMAPAPLMNKNMAARMSIWRIFNLVHIFCTYGF